MFVKTNHSNNSKKNKKKKIYLEEKGMVNNNIFEPIVNQHGVFGLQVKDGCKGVIKNDKEKYMTLLAWTSPYATERQNHWMQKKLQRIYSRYYVKVMFSNYGLFWGDKEGRGVQ